jgi:hypothetical protein
VAGPLCGLRYSCFCQGYRYQLSLNVRGSGNGSVTGDFADQLLVMDNIKSINPDCIVKAGGDFNVDLCWPWVHTLRLSSLCSNSDLNLV